MTHSGAALPLLLLAGLFVSLCVPSTLAADAVATVQVDGVNVTVDNEVCETAAWRVSAVALLLK